MPTAAIVFSDGCEEIEGLSQVDVLRRLGIPCDMVALDDLTITGGHDIRFTCDKLVDESLLDYDLVAFPGGAPNAKHLRESEKLADLMKQRFAAGKWNAAMCASPIALSKYGFLKEARTLKNKLPVKTQPAPTSTPLLSSMKTTSWLPAGGRQLPGPLPTPWAKF